MVLYCTWLKIHLSKMQNVFRFQIVSIVSPPILSAFTFKNESVIVSTFHCWAVDLRTALKYKKNYSILFIKWYATTTSLEKRFLSALIMVVFVCDKKVPFFFKATFSMVCFISNFLWYYKKNYKNPCTFSVIKIF